MPHQEFAIRVLAQLFALQLLTETQLQVLETRLSASSNPLGTANNARLRAHRNRSDATKVWCLL
jgi:hypothetical protein